MPDNARAGRGGSPRRVGAPGGGPETGASRTYRSSSSSLCGPVLGPCGPDPSAGASARLRPDKFRNAERQRMAPPRPVAPEPHRPDDTPSRYGRQQLTASLPRSENIVAQSCGRNKAVRSGLSQLDEQADLGDAADAGGKVAPILSARWAATSRSTVPVPPPSPAFPRPKYVRRSATVRRPLNRPPSSPSSSARIRARWTMRSA